MKGIKFVIGVIVWCGATFMLCDMALDALEWQQERQAEAAEEYRRLMDQELRVEYAVYRARQ
jgi:hypothetical protein